jgi:tRNA(adenine34) deaminase
MNTPEFYMKKCLELAQKAAEDGESPVGSILVKDGRIIGEAYEKSRQLKDITRHAEMLAILDALRTTSDLSGSTIYSNVEPCILCSYAIRHYKIGKVVFMRYAGELGGTNPPCNVLTAASFKSWGPPPEVIAQAGQSL